MRWYQPSGSNKSYASTCGGGLRGSMYFFRRVNRNVDYSWLVHAQMPTPSRPQQQLGTLSYIISSLRLHPPSNTFHPPHYQLPLPPPHPSSPLPSHHRPREVNTVNNKISTNGHPDAAYSHYHHHYHHHHPCCAVSSPSHELQRDKPRPCLLSQTTPPPSQRPS